MQLRRAWGKADDLYYDMYNATIHLYCSNQFSIEKRNDISRDELTFACPVDNRLAILWRAEATIKERLRMLCEHVVTDKKKVHKFLRSDTDSYDEISSAVPVSVTPEQAQNKTIGMFIRKYGGDVTGSSESAWVDRQLEFVSGIKTWSDQEFVNRVKLHKVEWLRESFEDG